MKKILLATALAAVSISATEANWGGFYARGGLAGGGEGTTTKWDDKNVRIDGKSGEFKLNAQIEVAAGWGMIISNAVYLGVDAQLGNFKITHSSPDSVEVPVKIEGKSSTDFAWNPNLQVRVGLPLKSAMPYIAGGLGLYKSFKEQDMPKADGTGTEKKTQDMMYTWSVRLGSDFKVSESFFVGVFGQFARTFSQEIGKEQDKPVTRALSEATFGFTAGYQF
jgi:opacity protein-like surface antigen